jgi:GNAT superfamily N-acetyltransferase
VPGDLSVREIGSNEAARLLEPLRELAMRAKASWGYDEEFLAAFRASSLPRSLTEPGRTCVVAELDGALVGFMVLDELDECLWLEDMWVEPGHFGHGIGRALFEDATARLRASGRSELRLESDPGAEGFYARMGARRTGTRRSTIAPGRELPLMGFCDGERR